MCTKRLGNYVERHRVRRAREMRRVRYDHFRCPISSSEKLMFPSHWQIYSQDLRSRSRVSVPRSTVYKRHCKRASPRPNSTSPKISKAQPHLPAQRHGVPCTPHRTPSRTPKKAHNPSHKSRRNRHNLHNRPSLPGARCRCQRTSDAIRAGLSYLPKKR